MRTKRLYVSKCRKLFNIFNKEFVIVLRDKDNDRNIKNFQVLEGIIKEFYNLDVTNILFLLNYKNQKLCDQNIIQIAPHL